jgi:hypothetical protein
MQKSRDLIRIVKKQGATVVKSGTHAKIYKGPVLVAVVGMMHDAEQGGDKTMLGVRSRLRRAGFVL